ncbi:MAG TPA: glycosyltransferase [Vicinamibacterales bacterium]|nr:glycosyltransferase [Vicinamibacterales bacterium]
MPAEGLYQPPPHADRLPPGPYGDCVLVVGRLETVKRADMAIAALAHVPAPMRLIIAGDGSQRAAAERAAVECGVRDRIVFAGTVVGEELVNLYAGALAVSTLAADRALAARLGDAGRTRALEITWDGVVERRLG